MTEMERDALQVLANASGTELSDRMTVHELATRSPEAFAALCKLLSGHEIVGCVCLDFYNEKLNRLLVSNHAPNGVVVWPEDQATFGRKRKVE